MEALSRRRFFCALAASAVAAGVTLPWASVAAAEFAPWAIGDLTLSLDDFAEQILEPAMEAMAEFLETHPEYTVESLVWPEMRNLPNRGAHGSPF